MLLKNVSPSSKSEDPDISLNLGLPVSSTRFSVITFGAAPVTQPNLTPRLLDLSHRRDRPGVMLAIVNEYDIVPRADGPYLRSLVDLYRSKYGLPPIIDSLPPDLEHSSFLESSVSRSVQVSTPMHA